MILACYNFVRKAEVALENARFARQAGKGDVAFIHRMSSEQLASWACDLVYLACKTNARAAILAGKTPFSVVRMARRAANALMAARH